MSIEIYKVNNLFTIKRVSVYVGVWVGVYGKMECGDGAVWRVVRWWMD